MTKTTAAAAIALWGAATCLSAYAAAPEQTAASAPTITKSEAKNLKTDSEAQYDARKKVAEANESLNKADCKTSLDGSAKRACEKSAKQHAKSQKADAKTLHEAEEQTIDRSKKQ